MDLKRKFSGFEHEIIEFELFVTENEIIEEINI